MSSALFRSFTRNSRHAFRQARPGLRRGLFEGPRFRASTVLTVGTVAYFGGIATVPLAGYALYYFSGVKRAVDTFSPAATILMNLGDQMKTDKTPSHLLRMLRKAVKAYVAYIPGAGFLVDRTFDKIDDAVDQHAEEANAVIGQAYLDVTRIVMHGKNNHETHTALEIMAVCRRLLEDLGALSVRAGTPLVQQLQLDKHAANVSAGIGNLVQGLREKTSDMTRRTSEDGEDKGVVKSAGQFVGKAMGSMSNRFGQRSSKSTEESVETEKKV